MSHDELEYWFGEFWKIYPRKRDKLAAMRAYKQATKQAEPEAINAGARQYAAERYGQDSTYTKYPATWLHAGGWMDYEAQPAALPDNVVPLRGKVFVQEGSPQYDAWCRHNGRRPPSKNGGWWFDSEWPPAPADHGDHGRDTGAVGFPATTRDRPESA